MAEKSPLWPLAGRAHRLHDADHVVRQGEGRVGVRAAGAQREAPLDDDAAGHPCTARLGAAGAGEEVCRVPLASSLYAHRGGVAPEMAAPHLWDPSCGRGGPTGMGHSLEVWVVGKPVLTLCLEPPKRLAQATIKDKARGQPWGGTSWAGYIVLQEEIQIQSRKILLAR